MRKISIVIPVYNNEQSLEILMLQLRNEILFFEKYDFEFIFVDDGSTDNSLDTLKNLKKMHPDLIRIIKLSRNFGQLSAMKAGYKIASGDAVISISADLQDPVNLISQMISAWENGHDFVVCARTQREDNWIIRLTSKLGYALLRREVENIPKGGFDVFLFSSSIKEYFNSLKGRFNFLQGDFLYLGLKHFQIDYVRMARPYGTSGYTFGKRLRNFLTAFIDSSYALVRFLLKVGIVLALISFCFIFVLIFGWIKNDTPFSGFTFLACVILLLGGIQLIVVGLVGEYVWQIYDMSRNRPDYFIEEFM